MVKATISRQHGTDPMYQAGGDVNVVVRAERRCRSRRVVEAIVEYSIQLVGRNERNPPIEERPRSRLPRRSIAGLGEHGHGHTHSLH
jgi:hypothetical protein